MEFICVYSQMFDYMSSYDLACSIGGGEDSSAVLQRAGLTFICSCDTKTPLPGSKITVYILFCEYLVNQHENVKHTILSFSQSISVTT